MMESNLSKSSSFRHALVRIVLGSSLYCSPLKAQAKLYPVDCLGLPESKQKIIYLHGFEKPDAWSSEESRNREVLTSLAKQRSVQIAIPLSPFVCRNQQRCWASKTEQETLQTFSFIQKASAQCWSPSEPKDYSIIGFSNGGYFAFKLYKLHRDPRLKHIIGVGSAGTWDPTRDSLSPFSKFSLIVGQKEITLPSARKLEKELKKSLKDFEILLSPGGHQLDLTSLLGLFPESP